MANKKPKVQLVPPFTGVRRDVNPLVQDQTMADKGDNCLFFDGTIRPRPCMTKEVNDPVSGDQIFVQYQQMYSTEAQAGAADHSITASCVTESDGYIIAAITDQALDLSIDNGMTWTAGALTHPGSASIIHLEEKNSLLFAFLSDRTVYRAPVSALPSSLSWTLVGTLDITLDGITSSDVFIYDDDHDSWIILKTSLVNHVVIGIVRTASGSAVLGAASAPEPQGGTVQGTFAADWVNETHVVYATRVTSVMPINRNEYLQSFQLAWTGSAYSAGSQLLDYVEFSFTGGDPNLPSTLEGSETFLGDAVINAEESDYFLYTLFSESGNNPSYVGRMVLESDGTFDTSSITYEDVNVSKGDGSSIEDVIKTPDSIAILNLPLSVNAYPSYMVTKDKGVTWMQWTDQRTLTPDVAFWRFASSESRQLVIGSVYDKGSVDDYGMLFALPSSTYGFLVGDVTTAFQADLSDEDRVLIIGATHGLARLNRTTNEWDRITANDSEDYGADPWVSGTGGTAEIPPLSAYPDDTNYVAGTSINGVYGTNPWVFRTFEAQGETFLIGTNGQCYPICYHPDMPGGFARRLGEMTQDDPNYNALADSPFGDLAPKAKCIATAANRVLLANDPAGSKYSVSVGGFNDQDREWGQDDYQYVLLGDTPGGIVSMNEISALQVAVYKEDAIYHAIAQTEFLGVSAPFRFELSKAGISGPCSPASVVRNHDGRQMYLARDGGVYLYDGVAPIDLGANVRKMVQDDIDLDNLGKCWGVVDVKRKLIWFFYPTSDGLVNKGIVISTDQGVPYPVWPIVLPRGWDFVTGLDAILTTDITVGELGVLGSYDDDVTLGSFSSGRTAMLMGMKTGIFFSQEYEERSEQYTDDGVPIRVHLRGGWLTPGGAEVFTADTLHHIFSCTDPEQELEVRLRAQQLGRNIRVSKPSPLYSGKPQRRTRHRVSGTQFSVDIQGNIKRLFNWGGGALSLVKRGGR